MRRALEGLALAAGFLLLAEASGVPPAEEGQAPAVPPPERAAVSPGEIQAEPPPFSEGVFPCSECHTEPGDPTRRTLGAHEDVQDVFDHDSESRWCLDCHDPVNRDALRLAGGAQVPFSESYRLCGQCHGDKYRDWRAGVHGKRIGEWNGKKTYYLCVHCHNPHSPKFAPIVPEPRPQRPEEMKR
jgi:hypothetical protein